jgi:hypothetical protein
MVSSGHGHDSGNVVLRGTGAGKLANGAVRHFHQQLSRERYENIDFEVDDWIQKRAKTGRFYQFCERGS